MQAPGYWIKEDVFSHTECEAILRFLSKGDIGRSRAGIRNLMGIAEVRSLAIDERLLAICREISGKPLVPYKATLFEKTGKANWLVAFHQDTALPVGSHPTAKGWGPTSQKSGVIFSHAPTSVLRRILAIRIHLDPSRPSNGPLRVVPNSHNRRLNDDEFEKVKASTPEVQCCVGKGGIIAMSPLMLHASSKSETDAPRRVLHIEYAESLDLGRGIHIAIA